MGILDDYTWVVWQTYDGKWHSSGEGGLDKYANELARRFAKALAGQSDGTASFIGTARVAYCIHAKNRYQAIKLAKSAQHHYKGLKGTEIVC